MIGAGPARAAADTVRRLAIFLAGVLVFAVPGAAQTLLPEPFTDRSVGVELMRPMFENGDVDALSFAGIIAARLPLGSVHFVADLPFAHYGDEIRSSDAIGNVLVGVAGTKGKGTFYGTIRLPTASEDEEANLLGIFAEFHRFEAWVPNLTTLALGAILRDRAQNGSGFDLQFGAALQKAEGDSDIELLLDYGGQYVYRPGALGITGGVQGRAFVTSDVGGFAERTFHELRLRVDYTTARVRPAIGVALPLDEDIRETVDWVLRLGVQFGV